jgi:hypothetical protein
MTDEQRRSAIEEGQQLILAEVFVRIATPADLDQLRGITYFSPFPQNI